MSDVPQSLANLEAWLETMRGPDGYGGPVVHWWQNCLSYTGPGLDWRYEGIISGYLILWRKTGQEKWLQKARRAGDDLVEGQLPAGNFRHSSFEQNPYTGGTPHEAAADLGLLRLSLALQETGDPCLERYFAAAERNLQCFYLDRFWDEAASAFRDIPDVPSLVPNKACTIVEALFDWAALRESDEPIHRYALPTMNAVLTLQVSEESPLHGAIAQNQINGQVVAAYFPYYIARCIPAFLLTYQYTGDEKWLASAIAAGAFIARQIDDNGRLPQVLYERGQKNTFPQWIAPLGDVLSALDALRPYGFNYESAALQSAFIDGQLPGGGFRTAFGFGSQISQQSPNGSPDDFRDLMAVTGWCDKGFAYLATILAEDELLPEPDLGECILPCSIRGQAATWRETAEEMNLTLANGHRLYHWRKGQNWADVVTPELLWR